MASSSEEKDGEMKPLRKGEALRDDGIIEYETTRYRCPYCRRSMARRWYCRAHVKRCGARNHRAPVVGEPDNYSDPAILPQAPVPAFIHPCPAHKKCDGHIWTGRRWHCLSREDIAEIQWKPGNEKWNMEKLSLVEELTDADEAANRLSTGRCDA